MSKDLYLLRHAKSAWDDPTVGDRERVLNKRGRRDAPAMGAALAERMDALPVHVSPAMRARLTLGGLQDGWPALRDREHKIVEDLYTFSAWDLMDYIQAWDDGESALFLLGHNPGFTELVNWVCGEYKLDNLPTAGFVHLSLDLERWRDLKDGCGGLRERLFPGTSAVPGNRHMVIHGVALLSICLLAGLVLGDLLGAAIGVQANVGGVGIAMLLLIFLSNLSTDRLELGPETRTGVTFWSAMYIPIVVAMAAKQNVVAAVSSGWLAVAAGLAAVIVSFAMVPVLSRPGSGERGGENGGDSGGERDDA